MHLLDFFLKFCYLSCNYFEIIHNEESKAVTFMAIWNQQHLEHSFLLKSVGLLVDDAPRVDFDNDLNSEPYQDLISLENEMDVDVNSLVDADELPLLSKNAVIKIANVKEIEKTIFFHEADKLEEVVQYLKIKLGDTDDDLLSVDLIKETLI